MDMGRMIFYKIKMLTCCSYESLKESEWHQGALDPKFDRATWYFPKIDWRHEGYRHEENKLPT